MLYSIFIDLLIAIDVIVSFLIIVVVLMQRPKSEGLGAAFGGGMTENIFGAQTTNVLAGLTRWLGGIFFVVTLLLSILYAKHAHKPNVIQQNLMNAPKPAATKSAPAVPGKVTGKQLPAPAPNAAAGETGAIKSSEKSSVKNPSQPAANSEAKPAAATSSLAKPAAPEPSPAKK